MGREGLQAACLQDCLYAGSTLRGVAIVGPEGLQAAYLVAPPMPPTPDVFSVFWARNGLTEGREGFKKVPGGRRIHSG